MADGPLVTEAYIVPARGAKLVLQKIKLPPLKSTQVQIDMTHCGLCHTEIHMRDDDWGISNYPMVPGHEGIGIICKVGSEVKELKVGDRVGVNWIRDSCRTCDACLVGKENLCRKGYQGTYLSSNAGCWGKESYNEHGGCFSKVMRIEEKWAMKIPDNVDTAMAAPLMCGGATVFEPISDFVKPGTRVGIVGIGGLGMCAIKLAKLCGGSVTGFSRSDKKKAGALKAGAIHFVDMSHKEAMKTAEGTMELIIDTTPVNSEVGDFMRLLMFDGIYCRVGIPPATDHSFTYHWVPLIFNQKKIVGSIVTGSHRMRRMLDLAADNREFLLDDMPDWSTEKVPFSQVNECMDKLAKGENKGWRYLLTW